MSYCIHCGKPSDDNLKYCPYCGKVKDVVDAAEPAFAGEPSDPDTAGAGPNPSGAPQPRRHRGFVPLVIIGVIVGVIAAGVLVLTFYGPAMGIQLPWMVQEEEDIMDVADKSTGTAESTGTASGEDAESDDEAPDDSTSSGSVEVDVDESDVAPVPTSPQSVTGVATSDSGWPYSDSSMLQSYKIRSSSTLDPQSGNTYEATNVADNNVSTCWAEGVSGLGEGEWISFENVSGSTQSIRGLEIVNGYAKEGRFETNTTPVRADLYLIDDSGHAEKAARLTLMASDAPQLLEFSPSMELGPNESLRLVITESRLMSDGAEQDACISEVRILS